MSNEKRMKSSYQIVAEITQKAHYHLALPKDGHIYDFQGILAHEENGRHIIGEHKAIELTFPNNLLRDIYELAGQSGYIEKIDPEHDAVTLACACGARFIVSLREFNHTPPRIDPSKIKPVG